MLNGNAFSKQNGDVNYSYAKLFRKKLYAVSPNVCLVNGAEFFSEGCEDGEVAVVARNVYKEPSALVAVRISPKSSGDGASTSRHRKEEMQEVGRIEGLENIKNFAVMRSEPSLVILRTTKHQLYFYSFSKSVGKGKQLLATLSGHAKRGFGMAWSEMSPNVFCSSDYACAIYWWIITSDQVEKGSIKSCYCVLYHKKPVNDVAWNRRHGSICGSVGDDGKLCLWDLRKLSPGKPVAEARMDDRQPLTLAFSPLSDCLLATGDADGDILIWDWRNVSAYVATCGTHAGPVNQLQWSPHQSSVLASGGEDGLVGIWNIKDVGKATAPNIPDPTETLVSP